LKIYTIGFAQKNAQEFFGRLNDHKIERLIDIRLRPSGQLAGFAKKEDLPYFLEKLTNGCQYSYLPDLAPTKEILTSYRNDRNWQTYVENFEALMDERDIPSALEREIFASQSCCLLCSEATPEQCHRRLVAERLAQHWPDVEVIHL
jgi:uncharacterized protein (DUF488 family)